MTDSTVMMALGDYRFSMSSAAYDELARTSEWKWPSVERIGRAPALQYTGPGSDTIELRGTVYPHFAPVIGGLQQISRLRAECGKGLPLNLTDGTGRYWGTYCVTSLRETQTVLFSDGRPRKIDFELSLVSYGG